MKLFTAMTFVLFTFLISLCFTGTVMSKDEGELEQARSLVKHYGKTLKSTLKASLSTDGPEAAVSVCNIRSLPISIAISNHSGWLVARTALKTRNSANLADAWELQVLNQFEQRKAAGEDPKLIEYSETVMVGTQSVFRYMKAIPTDQVCLKCHGTNLTESITNKINSLYPEDKATGFKIGDIRGAFTFQKVQNK